jgi:hypothetical protein
MIHGSIAENMVFVKNDMNKHFVMPLKGNRKVALTAKDKKEGRYVKVDTIIPEADSVMTIYLEGVEFPLLLVRQVFQTKMEVPLFSIWSPVI